MPLRPGSDAYGSACTMVSGNCSDQPILERLLWERAVAHEGLEFLRDAEATVITQDSDGIGVTVTIGEKTQTLTADWLIGADGGRSFT
ncbi:FAD-dependent monooxygenase, partial [Streptomyces carpinensis]|uniref:FAD-dependent monooxygenase n=1 Tax=Streptomyces carpinensis TaxID=66369 RepID=UPI0031345662